MTVQPVPAWPAVPQGFLTVVAPDAVEPGAVVVGVVVLLPQDGSDGRPPDRPADRPLESHAQLLRAVRDDEPGPAAPQPVTVAPPVHEWLRPGLSLDRAGRAVTLDGEPLELTRREFDLLAHLASRPGRVLTREHLLGSVWGHDDPRWAGPRTVDVHVARLRRKLAGHGRCVQTVRGVGYRWLP